MPVTSLADPVDVAAIWRPLSEPETALAQGLIQEASLMIHEIPAVAARIVAGTVTMDTLTSVCANMVKRVMQNPDRLKSFAVTVDDGTRSGTYDETGRGDLRILPEEMNRLLGLVNQPSGAWTISPWYTGV